MTPGRAPRSKGNRGEVEVGHLLTERGFTITKTSRGIHEPDFVAEKDGHAYVVEAKNAVTQQVVRWRSEIRSHARARKCGWLLVMCWPGYGYTYLVEGSDREPCVWRGNGARP